MIDIELGEQTMSLSNRSIPPDNGDEVIDTDVHISLEGLSLHKTNQLKRLKKMIKTTRAFSLYYYSKARGWKQLYWRTNIIAIILSSVNTIVNVVFDPCSGHDAVRICNILLGAFIAGSLGAISFMNPSNRRRRYEQAGDEYQILSTAIYREVFFNNSSYENLDLAYLIEKFTISLDNYAKMFEEPSPNKVKEIIASPEFDLAIRFI